MTALGEGLLPHSRATPWIDTMSSPSSAAPQPTGASPSPVVAAWPRSAQLAAAFLLGITTALLAVFVYTSSRGATRPSHLERADSSYRIDLNSANRAELMQLPGIGDALADRLVDYRRERGAFRSVDDLRGVSGIGPATLERLRPHVQVRPPVQEQMEESDADDRQSGEASLQAPGQATAMTRSSAKKETNLKDPIDINHANAEDLQRLPGIGPKISQRIIDERQRKPFQKVDDLRRVSGIGAKTLEKLRPYVVVKASTPQ